MTYFKKTLYTIGVLTLISSQSLFAFQPKDTTLYFNGPTVGEVTTTGVNLSLSPQVLAGITDEEKAGIYFEYSKTNQVCIMIYPTPEYCLPKKTEVGKTNVTISKLEPNTSYTVTYKRDNTIRCITAPCPENGYVSKSVEFVTKNVDTVVTVEITKNLWIGSRGVEVVALQNLLIQEGYLRVTATGYFGGLTMSAVRKFQKDNNIVAIGIVGPLTKKALNAKIKNTTVCTEKFEGTVTAFSTQCFVDGICSITVDGKTVVTTRGWAQEIVGSVIGLPDFGSIENNIGAHAKVYAKKIADGYTLYGSSQYYVEIIPKNGNLPLGIAPVTDSKGIQGATWVWKKTVMSDDGVVTPNKAGAFTLIFNVDGNISGKTDCNSFFGSYTFGSDGFIKFGPLGGTLMFCNGSQEQVFTSAVSKVDRFSVDASGNLLLFLSGNSGTVYFAKQQ